MSEMKAKPGYLYWVESDGEKIYYANAEGKLLTLGRCDDLRGQFNSLYEPISGAATDDKLKHRYDLFPDCQEIGSLQDLAKLIRNKHD